MQINPHQRALHAQNTATRSATAQDAADARAPVSGTAPLTDAAPSARAASLARAREALRDAPEVDLERVEAVRAAIARGEVRFDADRLAGLIEQFHGSRG